MTKAGLLMSTRVEFAVAVAFALWAGVEKGAPMERGEGGGLLLRKHPMVHITGVTLLA